MADSISEIAKERWARIEAAMNLEIPDRVPCWGLGGDIIASYSGINQYEFAYDAEKSLKAIEKFINDFPFDEMSIAGPAGLDGRGVAMAFVNHPDVFTRIIIINSLVHDALRGKCFNFPGREIGEDSTPQFVGGHFMEDDEYDQLAENPIKFISETIFPRLSPNLETPEQAMATWVRVGVASERSMPYFGELGQILVKAGYLPLAMGWAGAPLDFIADYLRGFETVMLDLHRRPDKVKRAAEALIKPITDFAIASAKMMGAKIVMCPLHLNDYLSPKQYGEFYWPMLKEVLLAVIKEGLKPIVFFEGDHEIHLETILDLPEGWGVAYFEKTDVVKAKNILKGHSCIMGGIPISLLVNGNPETIDEFVKNLLDQVKPGGGFILTTGVGNAPRETPPQNISALLEAGIRHGKY